RPFALGEGKPDGHQRRRQRLGPDIAIRLDRRAEPARAPPPGAVRDGDWLAGAQAEDPFEVVAIGGVELGRLDLGDEHVGTRADALADALADSFADALADA